MTYSIRLATPEDCAAVSEVIAESARALGRADYTEEEIEAALQGVWGLDTQLIRDNTYFVICNEITIAACGGWSFRNTLFGSDAGTRRNAALLKPETDPARIRAFFVRPMFTRQGLGSWLLDYCEQEARAAGFRSLSLGATAPGRRLYERHGFVAQDSEQVDLGGGLSMTVVSMAKSLPSCASRDDKGRRRAPSGNA